MSSSIIVMAAATASANLRHNVNVKVGGNRDHLFSIRLFTKTKCQIRAFAGQVFSLIFHPTMSNALKKRKIAVLGSRSVGEFQFLDDESVEKLLSSREVVAC